MYLPTTYRTPERYGVVEFDDDNNVISIDEPKTA
jgi:dTDP-glucose pyrophosphorylase